MPNTSGTAPIPTSKPLFLVHDIDGAPSPYLLSGDTLYGGRLLAEAKGSDVGRDGHARRLTALAASWMRGRLPTELLQAPKERLVRLDLSPTDVVTPHTQAVFSIPGDGEFVADAASPVKFVSQDRGTYFLEDVADATSLPVPAVAIDGSPPNVSPGFTSTPFTTTGYGLATRVPRGTIQNADFNLRAIALVRLIAGLRLAREYRLAKLLTTSANWAAGNVVAATAKWNGGASNNPLLDLYSALGVSALPGDTLVLPESIEPYFHGTAVRDFVQAQGVLPRILRARAKYTVAGVPAYVWAPTTPANVVLLRTGAIPTSVTLRWLGTLKDNADGQVVEGVYVRQFYNRADDCEWITVLHSDAEIVVQNTVGALITGALA